MTDSTFSRKKFLQGAGATAFGAMASATVPSVATAATATAQLPSGFSYAPGDPPKLQPVKDVRGFIESITEQRIVVRAGTSVEVVDLNAKPFIWKNGPVQPHRAAIRLRVGSR